MNQITEYKQKKVETILTIAIATCILSGVLSWKTGDFVFWPLIISVIVLLSGLLIPKVGLFITFLWFKMANVVGFLSSKIFLTAFYFLFFTPYVCIFRLLTRKDVLNKKPKESLFIDRNKKIEPRDLDNPW